MGGLKKGVKKIGRIIEPIGSRLFFSRDNDAPSMPQPAPQAAAPTPSPAPSITPDIPVMPTPDDDAVRRTKRRATARQLARRGRLSTIFTEPDEAIGG